MIQQQVKIFTGFGVEGIERMEGEINKWLAEDELREIVNTQSQFAQDQGTEEDVGAITLIVTIWYRG